MSENKTVVKWSLAYLATIAAIVGGMWFFSAGLAEGAEVGDTGVINDNTNFCMFDSITPENVEIFEKFKALIEKLDDVGMEAMTQVERMIGQFLTTAMGCNTIAGDYRGILTLVSGDYALFFFNEVYGFHPHQYLIRLDTFHPDELL